MKTEARKCNICHSTEGKPRPIGGYEVVLKPIKVFGLTKLACQNCRRNTKRIMKTKTHEQSNIMNIIQKIKHLGFKLFAFILMMPVLSIELFAQPGLPSFPDEPSQAPIDGGLGILAAAGGAYAYKKLREKRSV